MLDCFLQAQGSGHRSKKTFGHAWKCSAWWIGALLFRGDTGSFRLIQRRAISQSFRCVRKSNHGYFNCTFMDDYSNQYLWNELQQLLDENTQGQGRDCGNRGDLSVMWVAPSPVIPIFIGGMVTISRKMGGLWLFYHVLPTLFLCNKFASNECDQICSFAVQVLSHILVVRWLATPSPEPKAQETVAWRVAVVQPRWKPLWNTPGMGVKKSA